MNRDAPAFSGVELLCGHHTPYDREKIRYEDLQIVFDLDLTGPTLPTEEIYMSRQEMQEGGTCPMEKQIPWQTYLGIILASGIAALGIYLIFFEKGQQEILSTLEKQKKIQVES